MDRSNKTWSQEEIEFLCNNWGSISVPQLAKHLGRSVNAVKIKAQRFRLGAMLEAGDYITLNQLVKVFKSCNRCESYLNKSWIKSRGMPVKTKKVNQCKFKIIYIEDFWKWAEKNRSFLDFSRLEPLALGAEPDWVKEQRKQDYKYVRLQNKEPWTKAEDDKLLNMLKMQKYTYADLEKIFHRSSGAIQRRCLDLHTKYRPVKADNHGEAVQWKESDFQLLAEGIREGKSYLAIGNEIGKSDKAVRGKVYSTYFTENADKVRAMLKNNPWGYGVPSPTVKQAVYISPYRRAIKKKLSELAGLLKLRMNELGYEPYWQKEMCANWNNFEGCTAGHADCDSCTEFKRIREQYCSRCGKTFFEREENRFCEACRQSRKKQAQKKWYALNKKQGKE